MTIEPQQSEVIRFGDFELDLQTGELSLNGTRQLLAQQPFRVLAALTRQPGVLISRVQMSQELWGDDVNVDFEHGLNAVIKRLRETLGDSAAAPRFIETLPRRGYRFIAPVELIRPPVVGSRFIAPVDVVRVPPPAVPPRRSWPSAWIAVLCLSGLALAAYIAVYRPGIRPAADRIALAVLPFKNLSGDPSQEYFSDGLTEEMITQLSTVNPRGLGVLARTSTMRYKDIQKGADEISKELHVDFLVEGSVRRENQRVRISAQLVRASDQTQVWAKSYERDLREILLLQREVAQDIAHEINVSVSPAASTQRSTMVALNPDAYEAYIKGRYFWSKRTKEDLQKAIEYFQSATRDEPTYAAGYDGLADSWIALGWYGYVSPKEAFPQADEAARKALALDDSLAAAHTSLAMVRFNYDWDWSGAERGFQRAIELDSDYPNAHHWYADYLSAIGRHEQAITESERARRLDPLSPIINAWLGWRHYFAHQYDAAVEQYRRTLELDPNFAPTHLVLGQAYEQQGRASEALAELQQAEHLARGGPLYVAALAHALAGAGRRADAERELQRLVELSARQYVSPVQLAIVHAGLGHSQEAIEWLEKGIDGRSADMVWIKDDPRFDPLRPDSRFQDIVTRLRFP